MNNQKLVKEIIETFKFFKPVYDEHVNYYNELLPHVLFGDFTRAVQEQCGLYLKTDNLNIKEMVQKFLNYCEKILKTGNDENKELISVSFLENLDQDEKIFPKLKEMMGPVLLKELAEYCD